MTTYGNLERETANDQRLRKTRELAPEIEWSHLAARGRFLVDRGSGFLYQRVRGDPLVSYTN